MKYIKEYESVTDQVIVPDVSEKDAKELIKWWNANTNYYHFKKRNGNSKHSKWNVMRQLTEKNEPEIGDYVIVYVTHLEQEWRDFINKTPGKIIQKNRNIIKIKYENVPPELIEYFTTNDERNVYVSLISEVVAFAPTEKEVLLKYNALKYNL